MPRTEWLIHVEATLRTAGLKRGRARDRVIEVLSHHACAMTPTEIEDELRSFGNPAGRASIYRVLDLLVERGLAERLVVDEGQARFEPIEPTGDHHHHIVCAQCGRLTAFDDPALERAIDRLSDRLGVTVDSHDVLLRGACARCS